MALVNFSIDYTSRLITHQFDLTIKQTQKQQAIPIHFRIKVQIEVKGEQKRQILVDSQV